MLNAVLLNKNHLIEILHEKRIKELSVPLKEMLQKLFHQNFKGNDLILLKELPPHHKANISITIGGKKKNILFIEGANPIIEKCSFGMFISFLEKEGASKETISTLKLYHYADGTENGTGKNLMSNALFYPLMKKRIAIANKELNQVGLLKCNLMKAIMESGFGRYPNQIDAYYYVVDNKDCFILTEELITYTLMIKPKDVFDLFIGPLHIDGAIDIINGHKLNYNYKEDVSFSFPLLYSTITDAIAYFKEKKKKEKFI